MGEQGECDASRLAAVHPHPSSPSRAGQSHLGSKKLVLAEIAKKAERAELSGMGVKPTVSVNSRDWNQIILRSDDTSASSASLAISARTLKCSYAIALPSRGRG